MGGAPGQLLALLALGESLAEPVDQSDVRSGPSWSGPAPYSGLE